MVNSQSTVSLDLFAYSSQEGRNHNRATVARPRKLPTLVRSFSTKGYVPLLVKSLAIKTQAGVGEKYPTLWWEPKSKRHLNSLPDELAASTRGQKRDHTGRDTHCLTRHRSVKKNPLRFRRGFFAEDQSKKRDREKGPQNPISRSQKKNWSRGVSPPTPIPRDLEISVFEKKPFYCNSAASFPDPAKPEGQKLLPEPGNFNLLFEEQVLSPAVAEGFSKAFGRISGAV